MECNKNMNIVNINKAGSLLYTIISKAEKYVIIPLVSTIAENIECFVFVIKIK